MRKVLFFALMISLFAGSCSVFKKSGDVKYDKTGLEKNKVNFQTISAGITLTVEGEQGSDTYRGRLRAKKDSVLWFSFLTPFGMEALRLQVTPDSLYMLSRLEREYFKGNTNTLENFIGFQASFHDFQHILFADFPGLIKRKAMAKGDTIIHSGPSNAFSSRFVLNENRLVKFYQKDYPDKGIRYETSYMDYASYSTNYLPQAMDITYYANYKRKLRIEYRSLSVNGEVSFPFSIPGSYTFRKF